MLKMWALMILLLNLLPLQLQMVAAASSADHQPDPTHIQLGIMKKPEGCKINKCGDVDIPYPFGIGPNCSHNHFFNVTCDHSFHPPRPFLTELNLQVIDLTGFFYEGDEIIVSYSPIKVCSTQPALPLINLTTVIGSINNSSPYRLPPDENDLVVNGCYAGAAIKSIDGEVLSGCIPLCKQNKVGNSICQTPLPYLEAAMESYHIGVAISNETAPQNGDSTCVMVGLGSNDYDPSEEYLGLPPFATLQWTGKDLIKSENSRCSMDKEYKMEHCECKRGYHGNPYLPNGCKVPEECKRCRRHCVAHEFYYSGWNADAYELQYRCESKHLVSRALASGLSAGIGPVIVLLVGCLLYRTLKTMKEKRRRAKNFKQNGGLLLQQHMASNEHGFVEKSMIFTAKELEKATENFNKNRILGHGGQGTVYKGMLVDGRIIAIKKPKKVDKRQSQDFINEVVILSQINHRNVVKLLGCCLETDVPLLVYEYVPNGMLSQHIHEPRDDFHISWQMRLQIAAEVAEALAYLHSSSSAPIFHRDIKSNNILLDEKYRAKIADFGISRTVSIDQTHLTTKVVGTFGYLDPEYFRSHQFTGKSDVYSFGVVLLELLTGKKPIRATESDEAMSLVEVFLQMMESSKLVDILDPCVVEESKEELVAVANLATRCLNMVGSDRPTMKEVAMTLEGIRSKQPWSLGKICQEIEYGICEARKVHNYKDLSCSSSCTSSFFIDV